MLTAAHRVYRWDRHASSISSDRLEAADRPHLERAIAVYRGRIGEPLSRIHDAVRRACDGWRPDRLEAVLALLHDVAIFEWPRGGRQGERRVAFFEAVAGQAPVLDGDEARALVARSLAGAPDGDADAVPLLYADYPAFHRLRAFPPDYTADDLQADYDLAQAQALLYLATEVTVEARGDLKHIVQHARLARLLVRVERSADGYRLLLDGPNSVLRRTRAYGVDFARFLGALVQARDWQLTARIVLRKGWRPLTFTLSSADGLRSRVAPPRAFDSRVEAALARRFGAERDGWRLEREDLVLEAGDRLVLPDFVFRHADGTEVALEIVGYWTPEYLEDKLRKLGAVRHVNLLVAVAERLAVRAGPLPAGVLPFKTRLLVRDLLPRLEAFRTGPRTAR
jgi:uncharacterized protein